jgi:hypothetical protein
LASRSGCKELPDDKSGGGDITALELLWSNMTRHGIRLPKIYMLFPANGKL